ncbi:hypothetical protein [uncultured Microbacterium sp.]|nr:hypothetical protein [uncultured Microbacterium sp.]
MADMLQLLSRYHVLAFTPEEMPKKLAKGFGSLGLLDPLGL